MIELDPNGSSTSPVNLRPAFANGFKDNDQCAVTYLCEALKLRSNTVFVNGEFDLPKDFDPLADALAYRLAE